MWVSNAYDSSINGQYELIGVSCYYYDVWIQVYPSEDYSTMYIYYAKVYADTNNATVQQGWVIGTNSNNELII